MPARPPPCVGIIAGVGTERASRTIRARRGSVRSGSRTGRTPRFRGPGCGGPRRRSPDRATGGPSVARYRFASYEWDRVSRPTETRPCPTPVSQPWLPRRAAGLPPRRSRCSSASPRRSIARAIRSAPRYVNNQVLGQARCVSIPIVRRVLLRQSEPRETQAQHRTGS